MKAAQYSTYGGAEVIEINNNAVKPTPQEGQVLVEVHAASINPFDWKLRAGYMKDMIPLSFPVTIGGDFAGIVVQAGPPRVDERQRVEAGDAVYGQALIINGGSGSLAEFAVANLKNIAAKPKNVTFEEAAALPLVGSSAVQALEDHIKLQKNQRILIHGGAGGIGHIAIQIAKYLGAFVATTVSSDDVDFVKKLGADEII
ncbi:MAG: NADP-dependent oxidoreductase [Candidatus Levybacteria bacterium]|nr:NADP-dependent oxidoreductase [Candidatus Levybacteria bacterium]